MADDSIINFLFQDFRKKGETMPSIDEKRMDDVLDELYEMERARCCEGEECGRVGCTDCIPDYTEWIRERELRDSEREIDEMERKELRGERDEKPELSDEVRSVWKLAGSCMDIRARRA